MYVVRAFPPVVFTHAPNMLFNVTSLLEIFPLSSSITLYVRRGFIASQSPNFENEFSVLLLAGRSSATPPRSSDDGPC